MTDTPSTRSEPTIDTILARVPVLPILTLEDLELAIPLARALYAGGLPVLELTLRTPVALLAIERIAREVPEVVIGAGSVNTPERVHQARDAGAQFLVTPGTTPALLDALLHSPLPFVPGAATASEMMGLQEQGIRCLKFFPAEALGGPATLQALAGPLPELRFCPAGGIDAARARAYLTLPQVLCVGGSWVAPRALLSARDWPAITRLAAEAAALRAS